MLEAGQLRAALLLSFPDQRAALSARLPPQPGAATTVALTEASSSQAWTEVRCALVSPVRTVARRSVLSQHGNT